MKKIIGFVVGIIGLCCGLYVGGWLMFVQPIIQACSAFDLGTLTASMIGITILKCVFASFVGSLITFIGLNCGALISGK